MVQFASTTLPQQPGVDYNAQNISRQRKMADMLAQQGAEVLPAGQMVGNRFVPTPWTQGLAKALQSITGAYLSKQADTKEQAKSQKLSEVLTDPNLWRDRIEGGAILGQANQPEPGDIAMPPPQAAPESLASGPQAMPPIGAPVPVGDPAGGAGGITMPEITAPGVEVIGKTAPKMMTTAALIQALAQKQQETGVPMADLMQAFAPRIAQLSAMEKPTVLNQGDQMVNPLTGEVLAQGAPKPVAETKMTTEWVQKVGEDGQPLYDKNNDPVLELRTFNPTTGEMGGTALGIKPGNTGTRVTQSVGFPKENFKHERDLRNDLKSEPIYKAHQEVKAAFAQIKGSAGQNTPISDVALATKIMKLLDPGSVVRESELGIAMAASGLLDRVTNYANMVKTGQKLTPQQRTDFLKLADEFYSASEQQFNAKAAEYAGIAKDYNLNAGRVSGQAPSGKPGAKKGRHWVVGPDGSVTEQK